MQQLNGDLYQEVSSESEKEDHEEQDTRRKRIFKAILASGQIHSSMRDIFASLGIVLSAFSCTIFIFFRTLPKPCRIMYHVVLPNPEYWHELIFPGTLLINFHIHISSYLLVSMYEEKFSINNSRN